MDKGIEELLNKIKVVVQEDNISDLKRFVNHLLAQRMHQEAEHFLRGLLTFATEFPMVTRALDFFKLSIHRKELEALWALENPYLRGKALLVMATMGLSANNKDVVDIARLFDDYSSYLKLYELFSVFLEGLGKYVSPTPVVGDDIKRRRLIHLLKIIKEANPHFIDQVDPHLIKIISSLEFKHGRKKLLESLKGESLEEAVRRALKELEGHAPPEDVHPSYPHPEDILALNLRKENIRVPEIYNPEEFEKIKVAYGISKAMGINYDEAERLVEHHRDLATYLYLTKSGEEEKEVIKALLKGRGLPLHIRYDLYKFGGNIEAAKVLGVLYKLFAPYMRGKRVDEVELARKISQVISDNLLHPYYCPEKIVEEAAKRLRKRPSR